MPSFCLPSVGQKSENHKIEVVDADLGVYRLYQSRRTNYGNIRHFDRLTDLPGAKRYAKKWGLNFNERTGST